MLGFGSSVATIWERAAHSVNAMFILLCLFVFFVVSCFESGNLDLVALVPGHCLSNERFRFISNICIMFDLNFD